MERAPLLRDQIVQMCFERGLLVPGAGPKFNPLVPAPDHHQRIKPTSPPTRLRVA